MPPEQNNQALAGAAPQGAAPQPAAGAQQFTPAGGGQSFMSEGASAAAASGWSWGAFMGGPFFLIAVRKYMYLLLYLLNLIPLVNFIAWIGIMVFLGLKGRELAAQSTTFSSKEELTGFMKGFDHAGKITFFIMLALFVLGFLGSLLLGATIFSALGGGGSFDSSSYMEYSM